LSKKYPESELAMKFSEEKLGSIIFDRSIELNSEESATRDKIIVNISNGLVSLFEIFDNEAFILGGSMAGKPYDLVLLINQDIKNRFQFPSRVFPQILVSTQKGEAGIVGAALIAQNE
jgi:predicted NBD/HSP70 family sugar kinase